MCRQSASPCLIKSPTAAQRSIAGLVDRLAQLPDPRDRRGRRHGLVPVLLIAYAAVLTGAKSFAAIGQWAAPPPQDALARLGTRTATALGVCIAPSGGTIRRIVLAACPGGLADLLGSDPTGEQTVAVDGKTARGSRTADAPAAHLLAAFTGAGQVVSQLRVPDKTNEITGFARLLAPFDQAGVTVTADALHCQREHARLLVEEFGEHFVFTVKGNQKGLFAQLRVLPWKMASSKFYDRSIGPGRRETRVVQALTLDAADVDFPPCGAGGQGGAAPHEPGDEEAVAGDGLPGHGPDKSAGFAGAAGVPGAVPVGHREQVAFCSRCDVRGGCLEGPHRARSGEHGDASQLRDRGAAGGGVHQHRRGPAGGVLRRVHPAAGAAGHRLTCSDSRAVRL
nr:ISAs1 family transposase [Mangrovactinospora gilvigrisea]